MTGQRAVSTARRDFTTLTEAAALFSANIYDVPQQARKSLEEIRALRKQAEQSLEELAAAQAATLLAEVPEEWWKETRRPHVFRSRVELCQITGPETDSSFFEQRRAVSQPLRRNRRLCSPNPPASPSTWAHC